MFTFQFLALVAEVMPAARNIGAKVLPLGNRSLKLLEGIVVQVRNQLTNQRDGVAVIEFRCSEHQSPIVGSQEDQTSIRSSIHQFAETVQKQPLDKVRIAHSLGH